MQYNNKLLNILRFLLSASAILFGVVIVYSIYQNMTIINIKTIIALIISFLGGIAVGFTSIEDTIIFNKKKYTGLASIKQFIVGLFWAWGLLIGVIFLGILIYTLSKSF